MAKERIITRTIESNIFNAESREDLNLLKAISKGNLKEK